MNRRIRSFLLFPLINTSIQRGVAATGRKFNRFNGFSFFFRASRLPSSLSRFNVLTLQRFNALPQ
jgi:hypothetical protein